VRDWFKCITWPNISRLQLGKLRPYVPTWRQGTGVGETGEYASDIFKTACVARNIWRILNTIAPIWDKKYAWRFNSQHFGQKHAPIFTIRIHFCPKWGILCLVSFKNFFMAKCCPWTISAPQSSQFSSSYTLGELFASHTRNVHRQIS